MSQPNPQERLGIAGSGTIACGIAAVAGPLGEVVLWARSERSAQRAGERVGGSARVVTAVEELAGCSIVVEAVVEDGEVKDALLGRLGELLDPSALLATTTSSLSVATLAESSGRPDRFGALHFFNPVERMALVELAFPAAAAPATRERLTALCADLGKTAIEVPDTRGFVVNRLLFPYLFDAMRLLETNGLTPEALDECMTLGAGHPMGPLALLDFVGLDVAAAIGESLGVELPARLTELVAAGRLGRKTGAGFYEY